MEVGLRFRHLGNGSFSMLRFKHALATEEQGNCISKISGSAVSSATKRKSVAENENIGVDDIKRDPVKVTKEDEFYKWVSIKDVHAKVAYLIRMADAAFDSKLFFPRQLHILPGCVAFWKKNFSHWNIKSLESSNSLNIATPECLAPLSQTLASVYTTNNKLSALSDVSVAASEFGQFLRLCQHLRREAKKHKGLNSGTLLLEPAIYEALARYFASKSDWPNLNGLFKRLEQDGLPASKKLYMYGLECLGRMLRNTISVSLPPSLTPYSPAIATSFTKVVVQNTSGEKELKRRITEVLHKLVEKAESEGHDLTTGLMELPRSEGTIQHVLYALECAKPDTHPNLFYLPEAMVDCRQVDSSSPLTVPSERSYPVERHLNSVPHAMRNSFAGVFSSVEDLLRAFDDQFALEKQGEVRITPVLSPFPVAADSQKKPPVSPELRAKLLKGLMAEQDRWRVVLMTGFKDLLRRLKSTHSRDKITVYPFLKILAASHYVDLMVKAIDNVALDSALQHVNSYLVCLQLGQCVEAACNMFRRDKLGVLDELKHVYRDYGIMFNEERMVLPHFRHMWLHALDKRVKHGVSLNQDWPEWTSSVHFSVGHALYSLIYDRVRFNRDAPTRIRHAGLTNPHWQHSAHQSARVATELFDQGVTAKRPEEAPVLFEVCAEYPHEMRNEVKIHPTLANWYRDAEYPPLSFHPAELPMLCPPIPWTDTKDAGYLMSRNYATRLMRHSHASPVSNPVLNDDLDFDPKRIPAVFDALNCLAACPWRVNETILDSLIHVARSGGNRKLSVPERVVHTSSESLCITQSMNYEERRQARRMAREAQQQYDEARSLWASELYRLSIANQYRGRVFWFPHSMDFRGRVYPCPPHFHHMGSDIARGLIVFAKGLPLGPKGLDWLKIHLVNLTGLKKRCSNNERLAFANSIMDDIIDSALNPFEGRRWWQEQEEPWQTLACCREIAAALHHESGPESFVSHFPVHQDGSCNGLQHYAALGRDCRGAESVNLTDKDCPQDVYGDVVEVVEEQRRKDAAAGLAVAQILDGFVRRKVIKQSVMTTVYGVTLYGASEQIRKQLRDLDDFPAPEWIRPAAAYLAKSTLTSIGRIFTSSSEIQAWFGQLAHHISRNIGSRVSWETPMGLPVTQPYMHLPKSPASSEYTVAEASTSSSPFSPPPPENPSSPRYFWDGGGALLRYSKDITPRRVTYQELPVPNPIKQKNAFPPNFIHSLDSCHMMLTALHCLKAGITFASVHDCFWTHATTVDTMNRICREEFIALHSEPILQNFADYLRSKFAYSSSEIENMTSETKRAKALAFNELLRRVPKQGTFDLNEVRKSTYFFS